MGAVSSVIAACPGCSGVATPLPLCPICNGPMILEGHDHTFGGLHAFTCPIAVLDRAAQKSADARAFLRWKS